MAVSRFSGSRACTVSNDSRLYRSAANENVDFAVVPLENAIEGSVNITVDYLVHGDRFPL